jgi:LacI family transcriptional regulator, repressor for deo operon, udp, cdd, tsx, nupC, and nupG
VTVDTIGSRSVIDSFTFQTFMTTRSRAKSTRREGTATIADVAKLAGVSEATVSRAMRDFPQVRPELRDRVLSAAAELHYVADSNASRLASGKTRTVGLVAPQLTTWYVSQMSAGLEDVLHPAGNDLLISALSTPTRRQELRDGRATFRQRVDAVVLVDAFVGHDWTPPPSEPPSIVVGERLDSGFSLGIDDEQGGAIAVGHLVELGHRKIGFVGGKSPVAAFSPVSELRQRGALRSLSENGLSLFGEYNGMFSIAGGHAVVRELLALPKNQRPTALFCFSDEMAFGALQAARELGISIPNELSIIGFDDHPVAESVGLTTVRQPVRELGRRAAHRVLEAIAHEPDDAIAPGHELLPIELVVRSSTASTE